ncbi:MAG: TIGR03618 family F420-dependent PPOX class oxidoreductase [Candidatus Limnocylindrales bacterium]
MAQPNSASVRPDVPVETGALELLTTSLRFVTVATINPDGSPHQAVAWFRYIDDAIVINSREGRVWPTNLRRDPRISVTIEDGYRWVSVRGTVAIVDDPGAAQADIAEMARRYHADEPERAETMVHERFERQERVSFRLPLATSKLHYHED